MAAAGGVPVVVVVGPWGTLGPAAPAARPVLGASTRPPRRRPCSLRPLPPQSAGGIGHRPPCYS